MTLPENSRNWQKPEELRQEVQEFQAYGNGGARTQFVLGKFWRHHRSSEGESRNGGGAGVSGNGDDGNDGGDEVPGTFWTEPH